MTRKLVLVEDEIDISEPLKFSLESEGFEVLVADDGIRGLELIQRRRPHVAILDVMLPGMDGLEICRRMRVDSNTREVPVLLLTAKDDQTDIVLGLGLGADDYMTKPFSTKELVARVQAVLNRGHMEGERAAQRVARVGSLVVDLERYEVNYRGQRYPLTATEFRILHTLASRPNRVFQRDELLSEAIGEGAFVIDRNIDVHIRAIRKKVGHPRLIKTIRGVGYRLDANEAEAD